MLLLACRRDRDTIRADDAGSRPKVVLPDPPEEVLVIVRGDGTIVVDDVSLSIPDLEAAAAGWTAKRPTVHVRIAADRFTAHSRVLDAIEAMKRGGVKKFALLVAPKASGS